MLRTAILPPLAVCGLPVLALLSLNTGHAAEKPVPRWIWHQGGAREGQTIHLRRAFELPARPAKARLVASCDNHMQVYLNGRRVIESGTWESPVRADVTKDLRKGRNVLAVRARNEGGPAGFIASLEVKLEGGGAFTLVTDRKWRVTAEAPAGWENPEFDDSSWSAAREIAALGEGPWASQVNALTFSRARPPRRPQATPPSAIKTLPGFKVELLYSVPKETQGSWISLTVDPKGRLITSAQYGGLYRITLPPAGDGGGRVEVEPIEVDLGGAHGLLYAFDSLYVVRSDGSRQGLYRVRDTDGDDRFDSVELLRPLRGGGEHGPHSIILSPDGKSLFLIAGNHTDVPEFERSVVPRVWGEDLLLPRMWDASGHARGRLAPGGWIARLDPDGKVWELYANGYRNAFDIAFSAEGDLFTYDADMEWDIGTPWYRPTRVNHVVSGGEYGWRSGTGKWPEYYIDSLGSVVDIGVGSPTGIAFGYGARFPEKYQRALYICDWSYGKLYAVHLEPHGASWKGTAELFLSGTPLPLTDILIHPKDGAMYFTIGGRRAQSGLYRVTYDPPQEPKEFATADPPDHPRSIRRRLESFHGRKDPRAVPQAWPYLSHSDRYIRYAARIAIEHQPVETWQRRALEERNPHALIEAMVALARHGDRSLEPQALAALERVRWEELDEFWKLALIRAYSLVFIRMGKPDAETARRIALRFDRFYPADTFNLNRELSRLLVYLEAPGVVAKTLALLKEAPSQEEQIHYALVLRTLKTGWTLAQRREYFQWFHAARGFRGGHSFMGFLRNIKREAEARLTEEEKRALAGVLKEAPPPNLLAQLPKPKGPGRKWTVDEIVELAEGRLRGRDFKNGATMFAAAQCFVCHRFAGRGGMGGPDLTGVGNRFSLRDLAESIVEPSKVVSDQYQATVFVLADGRVVTGIVVNLSGDSLMVATDLREPDRLTGIRRDLILETRPAETSMMPAGLLDPLNEEEVLDLLAYLLSGGNPNHPYFAREGAAAPK